MRRGWPTTTLTLGPTAGANNNSVTMGVPGYGGSSPVVTASAAAGAATQISKTAGDAQTGEVAQNVAVSPKVLVKDALNNPVAGATVTWLVTAGGGRGGGGDVADRRGGRGHHELEPGPQGGRGGPFPQGVAFRASPS